MQNLDLEIETMQIGIYINIILHLLNKHGKLSVNKIMLFSYLVKKEKFRISKVYTANNTQDIVCKAVSLMSGEFKEYCRNTKYIIKTIHLLILTGKVSLSNNLLSLNDEGEIGKVIYEESAFINKAIEESRNMSDRQFLKEVISNV